MNMNIAIWHKKTISDEKNYAASKYTIFLKHIIYWRKLDSKKLDKNSTLPGTHKC